MNVKKKNKKAGRILHNINTKTHIVFYFSNDIL